MGNDLWDSVSSLEGQMRKSPPMMKGSCSLSGRSMNSAEVQVYTGRWGPSGWTAAVRDIISQTQTHITSSGSRRLERCSRISQLTASSLLNAAHEEGGTRRKLRKERHAPFCSPAAPVSSTLTRHPDFLLQLSPRRPWNTRLPWIYKNQLAGMPAVPSLECGLPAGLGWVRLALAQFSTDSHQSLPESFLQYPLTNAFD